MLRLRPICLAVAVSVVTVVVFMHYTSQPTLLPPFLNSTFQAPANVSVDWPEHWQLLLQHAEPFRLVLIDSAPLRCIYGEKFQRKHACSSLRSNLVIRFGTFHSDFQAFLKNLNSSLIAKHPEFKYVSLLPESNPDTVALEYTHKANFVKSIFITWLRNNASINYHLLRGEGDAPTIAVRKFTTSTIVLPSIKPVQRILIPKELARHFVYLDNGRFVECNRTLAANVNSTKRVIPVDTVEPLAEFLELLLATGQLPMMSFGTLLGWYRDCTFIPFTTDVDFNVRVDEYPVDFEKFFIKHPKFPVSRKIGMHEYGLELSFWMRSKSGKHVSTDIFYLYENNATTQWTPLLFDFKNKKRAKCLVPKVTEVCTADLHDHVFFLPCNFFDHIIWTFGPGWSTPNPHAGYFGKGMQTMTDETWNVEEDEIVKYYK